MLWITHRDCVVSVLGDIKKPAGHNPQHSPVDDPAVAGDSRCLSVSVIL